MPEQKDKNKQLEPQRKEQNTDSQLDAASKSLSDALRISFGILKVIIFILLVLFLASGFRTIEPDERALVLRFGKITGEGEARILEPGLHWSFPYPIDEVVRIPVEKKVSLPVNSFWYYQNPAELLPEGPRTRPRYEPTLDPIKDGYCITRSAEDASASDAGSGSDYNIVHNKWQLIYQIDQPERFFKNMFVEKVNPGQKYFDVIKQSLKSLLGQLLEDAVTTTMVNYTIDEALFSKQQSITNEVKTCLQEKLDRIQSGIKVTSIQLTNSEWPRQVDRAFQASIQASQAAQQAISRAKGYAEETLSKTAGAVSEELLDVIKGDKNVSDQQEKILWNQLAGDAQAIIAKARAYRKTVVENAKANSDYLKRILPEYRKRPKLVLQEIYQDTIETVLNNADEKIIIQPTQGSKDVEIRVLINRDPTIKPQSQQEK